MRGDSEESRESRNLPEVRPSRLFKNTSQPWPVSGHLRKIQAPADNPPHMKKYALQFLISSIGLAFAAAAPNSLDTTFGAGTGKSATAVGTGNASISDIKVLPDGKILAGGT